MTENSHVERIVHLVFTLPFLKHFIFPTINICCLMSVVSLLPDRPPYFSPSPTFKKVGIRNGHCRPPFCYPADSRNCPKGGIVCGDSPQGRNLKRHIAARSEQLAAPRFTNFLVLLLSLIPDRFSILHIFAIYKKVGTVSGDPPP